MKIKTFEYRDLDTGWHLNVMDFDQINLLVGASGVGKTKILRALTSVARQAFRESSPGSAEWTLTFDGAGAEITWSARVRAGEAPLQVGEGRSTEFEEELLRKDGRVLIDRRADSFAFEGKEIPAKLDRAHSALGLFEREAVIQPIVGELNRIAVIEARPEFNVLQRSALDDMLRFIYPDGKLDIVLREPRTRHAHPTLLAYVIHRLRPERFSEIRDRFRDIFPVDDVDIKEREMADGQVQLVLRIRDRGSSTWIEEAEMSDGMLRTLKLLIEISFAAPGNVFLVDEIENGMGTNCLPEVTRAMLSRLDCQFVVTSHHPWVINNIPVSRWKLVSRHGSEVKVVPAAGLHALRGASQRQAFLRLIGSPEYEHGLA